MSRMIRTVLTVSRWAMLALVVSCAPASTTVTLSDETDKLFVTGIGVKTFEPDSAVIRMGVEASASAVSVATELAAESMDAMIAALKENGIGDDDIETTGFNIREKGRTLGGESTGFDVSNWITVTVRELDTVGELIDAATIAGGDESRFSYIEFAREDKTGSESELRAAAFEDARESATHYAELAGMELGNLATLSEDCDRSSLSREFATDAVAVQLSAESRTTTPILVAGEIEVAHCVTAVFELK